MEIVIVSITTSGPNHTTQREHIHLRDGSYCPAAIAEPFRATKVAAVFLSAYADAVRFEETFVAFVVAHPAEFPTFTAASGTAATIATVTR